MLELYHHGSSVCAAKVRLALAEKGVRVDRYHYVDILKGEQFSAQFLRINPNAVVPSLVHDGTAINESTLICEYADEVFPGPPLQPARPLERYRMRLWLKAVDELLHPACSDITYVSCHRHILLRMPPAELEASFARTPELTVKGEWRRRKRELVELGFQAPGITEKLRLYDGKLHEMEHALQTNEWLAGAAFSLADVALAPYLNRLAMLEMSGFWVNGRLPRVADWFERLQARPTFKPQLLDWCPPELTHDFSRYGAASWPTVREILRIAE